MTPARANEIVSRVIYKHITNISRELERCEDSDVVFNVGRRLGMMQYDLELELGKEVKETEGA